MSTGTMECLLDMTDEIIDLFALPVLHDGSPGQPMIYCLDPVLSVALALLSCNCLSRSLLEDSTPGRLELLDDQLTE